MYDLDNDPGEFRNLAGDDAYDETVAALRVLLKAGWQGALPAEVVVLTATPAPNYSVISNSAEMASIKVSDLLFYQQQHIKESDLLF